MNTPTRVPPAPAPEPTLAWWWHASSPRRSETCGGLPVLPPGSRRPLRPPAARRRRGAPHSQSLDDGHVRLAAALAHGLQAIARAAPFQLMKERRHEPGARRPERVPEGNRATVDVDPRGVRVQVALPGEHHRGEGFVDLNQIDVGEP